MLTERERIAKLEVEVVELKAALGIAGAFVVNAIQAVCDQLVDEQQLPAATRSEIYGRLKSEINIIRPGSAEIARGAHAALPYYPTKADRERLSEFHSRLRKEDERVRKETLSLRTEKPETGQ